MADKSFPSEYTELGAVVADDDYLIVYDSSGLATRKAKVSDLVGGWRDLRAPLIGAKVSGVSPPTLTAFGPSGGMFQYKFLVDDEVFVAFHIDHDIKQGSTVYPHVHWATSSTSTNSVKWELEYMIAARTSEPAFPAPTVITVEAAANATAWAHQVTEHGTGFTAPEVDSLILMHVKRITNGGSENGDNVFGLFVDLHYEAQQYGTLNRAPDFYT